MDRRTFLKTLMALSVGSPVPLDLFASSSREIDAAWEQARERWDLFEVWPGGALSFANYENLARVDAYGLPWAEQLTVEDIEDCQPLQWEVLRIYLEELDTREEEEDAEPINDPRSLEEIAETRWPDWFRGLQGERRDEVHAELDDWLRDEPDWSSWEDGYAPHWATGQGAALDYFEKAEIELLESLNIQFVDGDCPGNNYLGAHLEMPIAEANAIAERNGWPVRFV